MCIRDRIKSADASVSDKDVAQIEDNACPGCGCCSGMFTANSMNCLNEAIGPVSYTHLYLFVWTGSLCVGRGKYCRFRNTAE